MGSPEYVDAMRPEFIKWNNPSELLSSLDLDRAIRGLHKTANGITGWSSSILKQLVNTGGSLVKSSILYVVQMIAKNHLPLRVANFLTANLLTLLKKLNNSDRPISVGDIFIRISGGALLYNIRHALPKYMGVIQLGLSGY